MKILITGAASGIAYEVGKTLAKKGHFVYVTTHTKEQCSLLTAKIQNVPNLSCFCLDITKEEDRRMILNLELDILINHAGIGVGGSIVDMKVEDIKKNFEVNVFSTLEMVKIMYRDFVKRKVAGKIFVTSSLAGMIPIPLLGSYCATKSSLTTLIMTLRQELYLIDSPITVSLIEPGAYRTGFNQVMIDNKEQYLDQNSIFYQKRDTWTKFQKFLFGMVEKRSNHSIVKKIVKQVEKEKPKLHIKAPLGQSIGTKLFSLFFR